MPNKSFTIRTCLILAAAWLWLSPVSSPGQPGLPTYTITGEVLNEVDNRIFGGFFEKATWNGEIGSDAAISLQTGEVFPEVKGFMNWMQIPLLRYPGGTAVDYYPWYYLIDSMPGHHNSRPPNLHYQDLSKPDAVTSDGRMGLHEYIRLCKALSIEPHLVVNLGHAFYGKLPIHQAAQELGANLVAYCNDTTGYWAELRAANGDTAPFGVKYFQIGNETWLFRGLRGQPFTPARLHHYTNTVEAYARAMKAADPSIILIIDGVRGIGEEVLKRCGELISFQVFHSYSPWGIHRILKDGNELPAATVSPQAVWQALATAPRIDTLTGLSTLDDWVLRHASKPVALTEWNLNCWFAGGAQAAQPDNEHLAYGIGAASYLHAILRRSERIKLANQSMLVGTGWGITGIRVDTTERVRPQMFPTAMVTGLYARHHGPLLMEVEASGVIYYAQPLQLTNIQPASRVAEQDIVVTADESSYYVHVLSRSFDAERQIRLVFPERVASRYRQWLLSDRVEGSRSPYAAIEELQYQGAGQATVVAVPPRIVSVFEFKKQP